MQGQCTLWVPAHHNRQHCQHPPWFPLLPCPGPPAVPKSEQKKEETKRITIG
jgi:hypothetical protein